MPRPHAAMRKIREALRLRHGEGLSLRLVSNSLDIPFTTAADLLRRAEEAGIKWPIPPELDDEALEAPLYKKPPPPAGTRPLPAPDSHRRAHRNFQDTPSPLAHTDGLC